MLVGKMLPSCLCIFAIFLLVTSNYGAAFEQLDDQWSLTYQSDNLQEWPVPYERRSSRPQQDPYCQARYPFCPTGLVKNPIPDISPDDVLDIYALKAPVWEFLYGDLLKHLNIMHDAIGFRSRKTGLNYTLEWYELNQLLNCTFPHVRNGSELFWCNQGASCLYPGIDDRHWAENGTLAKVGEITGQGFNKFADWLRWDNATGLFYETWTVWDGTKESSQMWFDSFDCASFVVRALDALAVQGANFNRSIELNYTRLNLYSGEPQLLGNWTRIQQDNPRVARDLVHFYSRFQPQPHTWDLVKHVVEALFEVVLTKKFYFYYNEVYWLLPMKSPYLGLTFTRVPLP